MQRYLYRIGLEGDTSRFTVNVMALSLWTKSGFGCDDGVGRRFQEKVGPPKSNSYQIQSAACAATILSCSLQHENKP